MPTYMTHFKCNYEAWPTDAAGQKAAWAEIIKSQNNNLKEGGPVSFVGWVNNSEGYALLEANSKAEVVEVCARFWPLFHNDIMELVPGAEAGKAILAGVAQS